MTDLGKNRTMRPTALVTGGARGIGRSVCETLVEQGWSVAAADVDADALAEVTGLPHILPVKCDVSDPESVTSAVALVVDEFGGLDFVCNNAGVGSFKRAQDISLEEWNRVWAINVTSVLLVSRTALPYLARSGRGSIVNIASDAAIRGVANRAAYCTTKGAVVSLTLALAADFIESKVRVNAISPAAVDSDWLRQRDLSADEIVKAKTALAARIPLGRLASPADIARTVAWLASEQSSYITAQNIMVDGGANSIRMS